MKTFRNHCNIKQPSPTKYSTKNVRCITQYSFQFTSEIYHDWQQWDVKKNASEKSSQYTFFVRTVLKEIRAHLDQNLIGQTYPGRREFKPVCQTFSICSKNPKKSRMIGGSWKLNLVKNKDVVRWKQLVFRKYGEVC